MRIFMQIFESLLAFLNKECAPGIDSWVQPTISFLISWDFSMFYQIYLSPQMKRWAIITYKHGIYQLLHEFRTA